MNHEKTQFRSQYSGLRNELDKERGSERIISVYLVPNLSKEILESVREEFLGLTELRAGDHKSLFLWQEEDEIPDETAVLVPSGSISTILRGILEDEQLGQIEPLSDYLRHTLKALLVFIQNGFAGYPYATPAGSSGLNPATSEVIDLATIRQKSGGFIGVQWGEAGLLKIAPADLRSRRFQYSEREVESRNWIEISRFLDIVDWLLGKSVPQLSWEGVFPASTLVRITRDYQDNVYIGIRGGEKELADMDREDLLRKSWKAGPPKSSPRWIPGSRFHKIATGIIDAT